MAAGGDDRGIGGDEILAPPNAADAIARALDAGDRCTVVKRHPAFLAGGAQALHEGMMGRCPAIVEDHRRCDPPAIDGGQARNVIFFLGDGMGDSEITVARNYQVGANGRLSMDSLPLTGEYTTYALQESNPARIDYVTDSAASGTGWATGFKTSNGRISSVAGTGAAVTRYATILELAQKAGFKTELIRANVRGLTRLIERLKAELQKI
jgi:alkaline phosphatase